MNISKSTSTDFLNSTGWNLFEIYMSNIIPT